ncbi:MAG: hypothetical protein J0L70_23655 [Leptolyngbya sp. UWPOB_LEPTO1]|uniref:hypothetical protein n=1 Tax=Leptolyngbya sp. UWPOB_LEPTO1 TaxID=2815653 RepID=UPI001AD0B05B|nr:hypothetical protein [Leptolyngbya sp. UWPOB_LEPTO1]MBN8563539.1 hypothetical protein [Leptolyngbya sp. UWPOB_LEPTO1]
MNSRKYDLLSDDETAQILGISKARLYNVCAAFDHRKDDEWELTEGEHFEWLSKNIGTRRFYEEGAMAIAKYLEETDTSGFFASFFDAVIERFTQRRKRTRQMLVRRRVIQEFQDLNGVIVKGDLVFIDRPRVIRILDTNGKGLNAAAKREQNNCSLKGREPMETGVHFERIEDVEYWSQRGLARVAQNMSENLGQKSRRAWTEAVNEIVEDAVNQQKKYLDSFDARVRRAMDQVKAAANRKCQVSLVKQTPANPFDLHAHHLFDKATRRDLAAFHDNLLVMHKDIHCGFHNWHGSDSCEPKHFVEYLTTVESWRFNNKKMSEHLHSLINRLEKLQGDFESRPHLTQN